MIDGAQMSALNRVRLAGNNLRCSELKTSVAYLWGIVLEKGGIGKNKKK